MSQAKEQTHSNGLIHLLFNIIIPVMILNKGSKYLNLSAGWALLIALAFPLSFGVWGLIQTKKVNPLSALGLINVGITGTLAWLGLGGIWFSIKEACFPFLIGVFVYYSAQKGHPFIRSLILNPAAFDIKKIEERLAEKDTAHLFEKQMVKSTKQLSISFFFSAVINFVLAEQIFIPLDSTLDAESKSRILNEQISHMTASAAMVIVIPSTIFLIIILLGLLKEVRQITGLSNEEIMKN